ncbi:MAG: hypothetical protein M3R00_05105 [Pseudomonadota bacterium]|nr:hypothetical protein [Pseudomonadota bacterium]
MKKNTISEALVSYYTLNDFGQRVQATGATKSQIMKVINPMSSFVYDISSMVAAWGYKKASTRFEIDIVLRDYLFPTDSVIVKLNKIQTLLSFSEYLPNFVCQIFPIDLLCKDVQTLAAHTEFVLKLRPRTIACITQTAKIAQETIVMNFVENANQRFQQTVQENLNSITAPLARALPQSAPAPSEPVTKLVHRAVANLPTPKDQNTLTAKVLQVAKTKPASGFFAQLAGYVEDGVKNIAQDANNNNDDGNSGWSKTLLKYATSDTAKQAATMVMQHAVNTTAPEKESTAIAKPESIEQSVQEMLTQAAGATGTLLVEQINTELAKAVDTGSQELGDQLKKKEAEFLTQVRVAVVDNTAKRVLTYAVSAVACWTIVPNVTKIVLNGIIGEGAAEYAASAISWLSLLGTSVMYCKNVSAYRADREANKEKFATVEKSESIVTEEIIQQVESWLPKSLAENSSTLGLFETRCKKELPEIFMQSGNPQPK